jgi:hypothetical protein
VKRKNCLTVRGDDVTWILKEEWYWVIVVAIILVLVLPLAIIWLILNLPPLARMMATIAIIVVWGIVAGYKDWLTSKRREEEKQK